MYCRGFRFLVSLLAISISLIGLILPAQMSSQSSDVDNEIDIVAPPEDCEVSAELSVTMDDCPPSICYGPTDEIVSCDDTEEPLA